MAKKSKAVKASSKDKNPPSLSKVKSFYEDDDSQADDVGNAKAEEEKPASKPMKSGSSDGSSVYKVIEVIGSSKKSWEHAAQIAIERASQTLEDLRVAEVVDQDLKIEDGGISAYRTKLRLSFKFRE